MSDQKNKTGNVTHWKSEQFLNCLPVSDVLNMTSIHWIQLLSQEMKAVPNCAVDEVRIRNANISHQQRVKVVGWMSEVSSLSGWSVATFFISVHAFDKYLSLYTGPVTPPVLKGLSVACLYFAAHIQETACDENIVTLAKFRSLCPESGSPDFIREYQAHLVDLLQGQTTHRKTPHDWIFLYLANLSLSSPPLSNIFSQIMDEGLLCVTYDVSMLSCLIFTGSGISLDLPYSLLVASVIFKIAEFSAPKYLEDSRTKDLLVKEIFNLPSGWKSFSFFVELFSPLISDAFNKISRDPKCIRNFSKNKVTNAELRIRFTSHYHPPSFIDWNLNLYEPLDSVLMRAKKRVNELHNDLERKIRQMESEDAFGFTQNTLLFRNPDFKEEDEGLPPSTHRSKRSYENLSASCPEGISRNIVEKTAPPGLTWDGDLAPTSSKIFSGGGTTSKLFARAKPQTISLWRK
eukprot:GHVP01000735.1.p1 GENE.GHVP01000735.1~~GHVP01000735.1.p1  ORF type:complete len:460 (+),score=71.17 GHVP01000735.1:3-1382(+)